MNCWIISPNVRNNKTSEVAWKDWICQEHKVVMGWDNQKNSGITFANDIQIGDIVLVAQGANWQKQLYLAGIINSEAFIDEDGDGEYQWRQLSTILTKNELDDLKLQFSKNNTYGNSPRIPALYRLKTDEPADFEIIKNLGNALMEKNIVYKYIKQLELQKNIVLTGAPGTGKTFLAKQIAKDFVTTNDHNPLLLIKKYYEQYKDDLQSYEKLANTEYEEFIKLFSKEKISKLSIDDYCLGDREYFPNNFSHWLEFKLLKHGSIRGGAAEKHIIYKANKYNNDELNKHMPLIRQALLQIIEEEKYTGSLKIWPSWMRKILYLYHPDKYFPAYTNEYMQKICELFQIEISKDNTDSDYNEVNKKIRNYFKQNLPNIPPTIILFIIHKIFSDKDEILATKDLSQNDAEQSIKFVQFHPSYDYTDFVEGLRPVQYENNLTFELKNGIFKELCTEAIKFPANKFVMIIDEINVTIQ